MDTDDVQGTYRFQYYYGEEAEQFSYYRIPRLLVTGQQFKNLSTDAKLLYGLMLDRMGLSMRNHWFDSQGRVYIYYPLDEIQEALNCGHNKGVRLLAELDGETGIGLIERIKQGQGNPTRIYVKRFTSWNNPQSPDFPKSEVKSSHNGKSRLPENGSADFPKREIPLYCKNQTDDSYLYLSIHQSGNQMEEMDRERCVEQIRANIGYEAFREQRSEVDELVMLIADVLCSSQASFRIGGTQYKSKAVKDRLASLEQSHIEYVLESMKNNTTKVRNIRGYLLTVLYNAPTTMGHYYQAAVQHDLYGQ